MPSLVKPLVFGGIDGLTTTLALVWGSIAAGEQLVSADAVLVLGVANLMATALSMGIGDYVGTLAEFEAVGSSEDKKSPLMKQDVRTAALRSGLTMFLSFVVFGGLPLVPYVPFMFSSNYTRRVASTMLCAASFFALGAARAHMEGSHHCGSALRISVNMLLMGSAAAFVSFCSSRGIHAILGTHEVT
jgi:VIT1/CCC1 family predicted Fe2+/Mn2+ transporter